MISLPLVAALALASTPKVGDAAPDFTAQDSDGNTVTLSAMLKDGPVILAFFPKAFTGGCTRELTAYKEKYPEVTKQGARLVAVSMDDAPTMKKFKESLKADYAMVPDPQGKVVAAYDVKTSLLPFAQRYTFVIGLDGKVLQVQSGSDAIDPAGAIKACPMHDKAAKAAAAKDAAPAAAPAPAEKH